MNRSRPKLLYSAALWNDTRSSDSLSTRRKHVNIKGQVIILEIASTKSLRLHLNFTVAYRIDKPIDGQVGSKETSVATKLSKLLCNSYWFRESDSWTYTRTLTKISRDKLRYFVNSFNSSSLRAIRQRKMPLFAKGFFKIHLPCFHNLKWGLIT